MRVLFVDFWNCSPHIETSFELAQRHLDAGDEVVMYFLGHDVPFQDFPVMPALQMGILDKYLPERLGAGLIHHPNFRLVGRAKIPVVENVQAEASGTLGAFKKLFYKDAPLGMGIISNLASYLFDSRLELEKYATVIRAMAVSFASVYEFTKSLLNRENPDLVYIFNGRFLNQRAAASACRSSKIKMLYHERGADPTRYLLTENMPHDRVQWQEMTKKAWLAEPDLEKKTAIGESFFVNARNRVETSWVVFTKEQEIGNIPFNLDGKKFVTYFCTSDHEHVASSDTRDWANWGGWKDQFHLVDDLIACCAKLQLHLVVRTHPQLKHHPESSDYARWLSLKNTEFLTVVPPDSPVDSYSLMDRSQAVITAGSTIGLEATFWGRPSILAGPATYDLFDVCHLARNLVDLESLLKQELPARSKEQAIEFGYFASVYGEKFKYFTPEGLFAGRFKGVNLQDTRGYWLDKFRTWHWRRRHKRMSEEYGISEFS